MLLATINSAKEELVLTTPYFVPEESLLTALISAARRGVHVILIVPAKVDSLLVRLASQAFKGELCAAGIEIRQFDAVVMPITLANVHSLVDQRYLDILNDGKLLDQVVALKDEA